MKLALIYKAVIILHNLLITMNSCFVVDCVVYVHLRKWSYDVRREAVNVNLKRNGRERRNLNPDVIFFRCSITFCYCLCFKCDTTCYRNDVNALLLYTNLSYHVPFQGLTLPQQIFSPFVPLQFFNLLKETCHMPLSLAWFREEDNNTLTRHICLD